ncbi:hypothetical protein K469DRAFT_59985 [Zopfia rhizophila CBS 207.26]|uniref:Uncharacterized protein n=1 Tax=Zopfia rhizophila CBS 207.26 TaxID=1314779 RepID=A0A6A6EEX1_9PEZI|nr:hypothetical protein K469DRAFT_59985 [Zopfia rhizophila CBS 207.26]
MEMEEMKDREARLSWLFGQSWKKTKRNSWDYSDVPMRVREGTRILLEETQSQPLSTHTVRVKNRMQHVSQFSWHAFSPALQDKSAKSPPRLTTSFGTISKLRILGNRDVMTGHLLPEIAYVPSLPVSGRCQRVMVLRERSLGPENSTIFSLALIHGVDRQRYRGRNHTIDGIEPRSKDFYRPHHW